MDSVLVQTSHDSFSGWYYKVKIDSVTDMFEWLAYLGTENGLNVFLVFDKINPTAKVNRLALSDEQCHVENARPVDKEYAIYHLSFRGALNWSGACVVFGDSVTKRFKAIRGPERISHEKWMGLWKSAVEKH